MIHLPEPPRVLGLQVGVTVPGPILFNSTHCMEELVFYLNILLLVEFRLLPIIYYLHQCSRDHFASEIFVHMHKPRIPSFPSMLFFFF